MDVNIVKFILGPFSHVVIGLSGVKRLGLNVPLTVKAHNQEAVVRSRLSANQGSLKVRMTRIVRLKQK